MAITYNRETFAVMMATPDDIEDFAIGFSLSEGAIAAPADIEDFEVVEAAGGIEARLTLAPDRLDAVRDRKRRLSGPTGCGLCGIDSLVEAVRRPAPIESRQTFAAFDILAAQREMESLQPLGRITRAVHAAALWHPARGILAVREDVGRHNALDKLLGAAARATIPCAECLLLLSSRVSIEMVQKACVLGAPVLVAVSAPHGSCGALGCGSRLDRGRDRPRRRFRAVHRSMAHQRAGCPHGVRPPCCLTASS